MEKKVIEIEIQDNSKTLKQQYKEAVLEVQKLADAFGATSIEVQNASKKAAELKDQIEDVNDAIQAQKGEGAFIALGKSISTVASGFSAVEGAMGLVGAESEDVQKAMLRVQSAMALAQGLEGLEDAGRAFKQLGAVVKSTTVYTTLYNFVMGVSNKETATNVAVTEADTTAKVGLTGATAGVAGVTGTATTAMKLFRLAIISTGIGVFIVLLGALIANFDYVTKAVRKVSDYIIKAYDYFDNLGSAIKIAIAIFVPFIGIVYGAIKALEYFNIIDNKNERDQKARHEANMKRVDKSLAKQEQQRKARKKAYDEETGNIDRQIKLLEAQGKSTEALEKLQLKRSLANQRELIKEARLNLQILRATNIGGVNDEMIEETKTAIAEMKQGILDTETAIQIARIESTKVTKDEVEKNKDLAKTLEDLTEKNKQYGLSEKELLLLSKLKTDALIQEQFLKSTDKDKEKQRTDALLANETDYNNQLNAIRKKEASDYETLKTTSAKDGIAQLVTTRTAELQIEKDTADKKRKLDEDEIARKKRLRNTQVQLAADAFGAIGQLIESFNAKDEASARRQFKISKAFNLAAALTNTYLAVTGALTAGGNPIKLATGQQFVEAGIAGTVGLANVVKIASTQFGGGGGGGGVDVPNPSSIIAPNLNVVGNTGINQLATLQQQPVKAYVVSNDITSAQQFDLKVQQTSQL
jgi:enamine deaminase RidA (YjgF/YER057c/UK114 family)